MGTRTLASAIMFEEGVVILGLVEDRGPGVSPVEDVVRVTSRARSSGSWHSETIGERENDPGAALIIRIVGGGSMANYPDCPNHFKI